MIGIQIDPNGLVYVLSHGEEESCHYDIEISCEKHMQKTKKYTDRQKKEFITWYTLATPEGIEKAKETNGALYKDLRLEFAEEVKRTDGFKAASQVAGLWI